MSYENQLIRESTGEGMPNFHEMHEDYAPGDTNCEDCGQLICACESLSDHLRETVGNPAEDVRVPASVGPHPLQDWLDQDTLEIGAESNAYTQEEADARRREWAE